MRVWFEEGFMQAAQYGKSRIIKAERTFFGKITDTARGFMRMLLNGLKRDNFNSEKVSKDIYDFVQDFEFGLDVMMGFTPFEDGREYALDNKEVTKEVFDARVDELNDKRREQV